MLHGYYFLIKHLRIRGQENLHKAEMKSARGIGIKKNITEIITLAERYIE